MTAFKSTAEPRRNLACTVLICASFWLFVLIGCARVTLSPQHLQAATSTFSTESVGQQLLLELVPSLAAVGLHNTERVLSDISGDSVHHLLNVLKTAAASTGNLTATPATAFQAALSAAIHDASGRTPHQLCQWLKEDVACSSSSSSNTSNSTT